MKATGGVSRRSRCLTQTPPTTLRSGSCAMTTMRRTRCRTHSCARFATWTRSAATTRARGCCTWLKENRPAGQTSIDDEEAALEVPAPAADEPHAIAARQDERARIDAA